MFQKKQYIFNENLGVCLVKDITKLSPGNAEPVLYYVLVKASNKEKVAYIPVEHHEVMMRELISTQTAQEWMEKKDKLSLLEKEEVEFVLQNKK